MPLRPDQRSGTVADSSKSELLPVPAPARPRASSLAGRPKVLFLAYFFPPLNTIAAVRTFHIAKWLARSGWDVTVVTPRANLWRHAERPAETEEALAREGIRVCRTSHPWRFLAGRYVVSPWETRGRLGRAIGWRLSRLGRRTASRLGAGKEAGWFWSARRACARLRPEDVDVVLATGTPFGAFYLARRIAQRLGRPYVLDYRDLWSGNPYVDPHPTERQLARERALLAPAAAAIVVSSGSGAVLASRFGVAQKIQVVTNGYDPEDLAGVRPHDFGHFAIVYTGRFYPPKNVVTPLLAALRALATGPIPASRNWAFHYYGRHEGHVREMAWKLGIQDKVVLHGEVSRREALSAIAGAGVATVVSSVSRDARTEEKGVVTGKIFEAIGLRTPLLVVAPSGSDLEGVLETAGLGRCFSADQTMEIAAYLSEVMAGRHPPARSPQAFEWSNLAPRLDRVLRGVLPS